MRIKFISLNVWDGGRLMGNILDFVREQNPDILALQEVYNGEDAQWEERFRTMQVFAERCNLTYSHFAPAFMEHTEGKRLPQGNSVFSRYPIESTNITFYDTPYDERSFDVTSEEERLTRNFTTPRNVQHVSLTINGNIVHVFNTQGVWGTDGLDNERRLNMVNVISKEIAGLTNVLLCGDFNFQLHGTKSLEILERSGVVYIFKDELVRTFNMRHKDPNSGYATAIVDGIFVSPNIKVISHECPDIDVSDHLPLVAEFEI